MASVLWSQSSSAISTSGESSPYTVGSPSGSASNYLQFDLVPSGSTGSSPTLDYYVERLLPDNLTWVTVYHTQVTNSLTAVTQSIGPGCTTNYAASAGTFRVRWVIGGSANPSITLVGSLVGIARS